MKLNMRQKITCFKDIPKQIGQDVRRDKLSPFGLSLASKLTHNSLSQNFFLHCIQLYCNNLWIKLAPSPHYSYYSDVFGFTWKCLALSCLASVKIKSLIATTDSLSRQMIVLYMATPSALAPLITSPCCYHTLFVIGLASSVSAKAKAPTAVNHHSSSPPFLPFFFPPPDGAPSFFWCTINRVHDSSLSHSKPARTGSSSSSSA